MEGFALRAEPFGPSERRDNLFAIHIERREGGSYCTDRIGKLSFRIRGLGRRARRNVADLFGQLYDTYTYLFREIRRLGGLILQTADKTLHLARAAQQILLTRMYLTDTGRSAARGRETEDHTHQQYSMDK